MIILESPKIMKLKDLWKEEINMIHSKMKCKKNLK